MDSLLSYVSDAENGEVVVNGLELVRGGLPLLLELMDEEEEEISLGDFINGEENGRGPRIQVRGGEGGETNQLWMERKRQ